MKEVDAVPTSLLLGLLLQSELVLPLYIDNTLPQYVIRSEIFDKARYARATMLVCNRS